MPVVSFTGHWLGLLAVVVFVTGYSFAMAEERLRVRKSVPVLISAAIIWVLVGIGYAKASQSAAVGDLARHTLVDFVELLLFLIPAMTYVNTLEERGLFDVLRAKLISNGLSLRAVFWITGTLAFAISPIADNLTTALLLGTVAMAVGRGQTRFVSLACINVVVGANAGGAFSPFGDITTLMVWQAGRVPFGDFFSLVVPSLVNWLVPAVLMSFAIRGTPVHSDEATPTLEPGTLPVLCLFLTTIGLTVVVHTFLELPPALGIMAGLGLLKGYSYLFNFRHQPSAIEELDDVFAEPELEEDITSTATTILDEPAADRAVVPSTLQSSTTTAVLVPAPMTVAAGVTLSRPVPRPLDIFALLEKIEWDTLLFFYGVLLSVGGLGALGYLALASQLTYMYLGPTTANVLVGVLSAVVDNVPVMFAVLQMSPQMSQGDWLLVTLTTGVGGSLLSIGSAAGVALMGQARGIYTFAAHLHWSRAVALGFAGSIGAHLVLQNLLQMWA